MDSIQDEVKFAVLYTLHMNLLANKHPKGGEYILNTEIDTEHFHYTTLPMEKISFPWGI